MENANTHLQPLLESAEEYAKTSVQLNKLRFIDVFAKTTANGLSRLLLVIFISLFVFSGTIAIALWLGDVLGKSHYGFLLVTGFYGLLIILSLVLHNGTKRSINTALIKTILKP